MNTAQAYLFSSNRDLLKETELCRYSIWKQYLRNPSKKPVLYYFTQIKEIWEQFSTYRVNTQGSSGAYFSSIRHPSKIVPHFTPEMRVTKLYREMWDPSYV